MRLCETVEVRQNLSLIARERGKIVARREGHNIWLDLGREWLAQLIGYATLTPGLTTFTDNRVRYMGVGVGGTRQLALGEVAIAPIVTAYPGTNNQTDIDPTVTLLERPVRVTGGSSAFPYDPGDEWLAQVQAPPTFPTASQATFTRVFSETDVSYSPYLTVPLSEIMLFLNGADPNAYNNTGIAYDTFDTLSKTSAFELEVNWTVRF